MLYGNMNKLEMTEEEERHEKIEDAFIHRLDSCHYRESSRFDENYMENHKIYVDIGTEVSCSGGSIRRCSSKRMDSFHNFSIKETWIEDVDNHGLAVIDDKITLDASFLSSGDGWKMYSASWAEQGQGFSLKKKDGIILLLNGSSKHCSSERSAKKEIKALFKKDNP